LSIKTNGYFDLIFSSDLLGSVTSCVVHVTEFHEGRGDEAVALKSPCMISLGAHDTVVNGLLVNICKVRV
jgi:hypothetical protein